MLSDLTWRYQLADVFIESNFCKGYEWMFVSSYELIISVKLPKIAAEGEIITLTYEVKNIGATDFFVEK